MYDHHALMHFTAILIHLHSYTILTYFDTILMHSCTILTHSDTIFMYSCTILMHFDTILMHSCTIFTHSGIFYYVRSQWRAMRAPARALLFFYFCVYFFSRFSWLAPRFYFCIYFFAQFSWVVPRNMAPHLAPGDGLWIVRYRCIITQFTTSCTVDCC